MQITPINYGTNTQSYKKNPSFGIVTTSPGEFIGKAIKEKPYTKEDLMDLFVGVCDVFRKNETKENEQLIGKINEETCDIFEKIIAKHKEAR